MLFFSSFVYEFVVLFQCRFKQRVTETSNLGTSEVDASPVFSRRKRKVLKSFQNSFNIQFFNYNAHFS